MNSKVTVLAFPGYTKRLMKYVRLQGFSPQLTARGTFQVEGDHNQVCKLLIDLKYAFPIGYWSGWGEPVETP